MGFDIETGRIGLTVLGENGAIKRKDGKGISIPSGETRARLIEESQKTTDRSKMDKFEKEYPKLVEGDIVVSGKKTKIHVSISYNRGKDRPVDDYKYRASKTILVGPNSEFQLTGFDTWDRTDPKTKERHHGESVNCIFLKKGVFHVSISNSEDPVLTPVASISMKGGNGSCFFDVYDDIAYTCPVKSTSIGAIGVEYVNLRTKKSFIAKSSTPEEIIVTGDSIYRRGLTSMDELFQNNIQLLMSLQKAATAAVPSLNAGEMANRMKNIGGNMAQGIAGLETLKRMSPEDLTRLMEMGGTKVTPELAKQMKEMPEMLKMMEKMGTTNELKKAAGMAKGYTEGMGSENIERMMRMTAKSTEVIKKKTKELTEINGKDIDEILERPRRYKPVTKEFGAVKVA